MEAIRPAAKKNKGKIIFVLLDSGVEENKQVLDFFGLKEDDLPEYLIFEVSDSYVVALSRNRTLFRDTCRENIFFCLTRGSFAGTLLSPPHRCFGSCCEDKEEGKLGGRMRVE